MRERLFGEADQSCDCEGAAVLRTRSATCQSWKCLHPGTKSCIPFQIGEAESPLIRIREVAVLMSDSFLGIPDPGIWLAYLLCLAATALCVIYALARSRKADAEPPPSGAARAAREKKP